jgi:hypothetical protein
LAAVLLAFSGVTLDDARTEVCASALRGWSDSALLEASALALNVDSLNALGFGEAACEANLSGYSDEMIMLMTIQVVCNSLDCDLNALLLQNCALGGYSERALWELVLVGASAGSVLTPTGCTLRGSSNRALREALLLAACASAQSGGETFYILTELGDVLNAENSDRLRTE